MCHIPSSVISKEDDSRQAEKGLLLKERKNNDERTVILSLTEQGTQALYEQTSLDVQRLLACLEQLSAEEQTLIFNGMLLLAERLEEQI